MKVKAKFPHNKFGFYGGKRRYDGDEFDCDPKAFSESWMVKLEDDKPKRGRKSKVEVEEVAETPVSEEGAE